MSRPITIHSDGTGRGTVILTDSGEKIERVAEVTFTISANGTAEATIDVQASCVNTKAELKEVFFFCPCCSEVLIHECDKTLGGESPEEHCEDIKVSLRNNLIHKCLRENGHDGSHFDGNVAWQ